MLIKKKKKILGAPLDANATSYHRVVQPLYMLAQRGHPVQFLEEKSKQLEQYGWADVLYIQCLYAPDAYQFYADWKSRGKKIVLDFDDDYINIPEDSPEQTEIIDKETGEAYRFPPEMRSLYVQMFIQLADVVTVTTPALKNLYSPWAKDIKIVANCVSEEMRRDVPKKPNSKIRILWSGSASHLPDLELIREPLKKVVKEAGDLIEFHFQGPLDFKSLFPEIPIIQHDVVEFANYLDKIQEINPDIALGPLKSNSFNASKSNLKYCQMTLMEAAFVGSKFGPYLDIDHEFDGMLAANEKEWVASILKLIENKKLRETVVKNAIKNVEINFMIEKHISRWERIINAL